MKTSEDATLPENEKTNDALPRASDESLNKRESGQDTDISMYSSPVAGVEPAAMDGSFSSPQHEVGSPMSESLMHFLGETPESDFFSIPTPTAVIWRAELERKNILQS